MRPTRRTLALILAASAALPFGAAVAFTTGQQATAQPVPPARVATPPPHPLTHHPPRPDLTPDVHRHGVPDHLSPAQVQALAQAKQPPTGVATASPTPAGSASATPPPRTATPTAPATGTPTPHPASPTPHATPGGSAGR